MTVHVIWSYERLDVWDLKMKRALEISALYRNIRLLEGMGFGAVAGL